MIDSYHYTHTLYTILFIINYDGHLELDLKKHILMHSCEFFSQGWLFNIRRFLNEDKFDIFAGNISKVQLYSRVEGKCESPGFTKHDKYLNGLTSYITNTQTDVDITDIHGLEFSQITPTMQQIVFNYFPPGTVLIIR